MSRQKVETNEKLCPFRRTVGRTMERGATKFFDRFGRCLGGRCMAYEDGRCLRFSEKKEVQEHGEKAERGEK